MPHVDHITLVTENKTTTNSTWTRRGGALVDFDLYPATTAGKGLCIIRQTNGGTGYVRIYDKNNAVELGQTSFTSSAYTNVSIDLSSLPTSELLSIQLQLKTNGTGQAECSAAVMELE